MDHPAVRSARVRWRPALALACAVFLTGCGGGKNGDGPASVDLNAMSPAAAVAHSVAVATGMERVGFSFEFDDASVGSWTGHGVFGSPAGALQLAIDKVTPTTTNDLGGLVGAGMRGLEERILGESVFLRFPNAREKFGADWVAFTIADDGKRQGLDANALFEYAEEGDPLPVLLTLLAAPRVDRVDAGHYTLEFTAADLAAHPTYDARTRGLLNALFHPPTPTRVELWLDGQARPTKLMRTFSGTEPLTVSTTFRYGPADRVVAPDPTTVFSPPPR